MSSEQYERTNAAARIRAAREQADLSQAEVAAAIGIDPDWYSELERNDSEAFMTISLDQLGRLASRLGRSPHQLVCADGADATDPIPMEALVCLLSSQLQGQAETVSAASERIGWDVATALADWRNAWRDWNADCLQDVARAVGVDWSRVVASWSGERAG